jgi:5'-methylthioadenosine phosphorylase
MSKLIGLVAGTVFYHQNYFADAEKKIVRTRFGEATVLLTDRWAYIPRHGLEGEAYVHAYRINHPANMTALAELGVEEIVGVNSSGSLRPSLEPGSVVLPNDYICLGPIATIFQGPERGHITPRLSEEVRQKLLDASKAAEVRLLDGGIYWQNQGPRLETRAEIQLQAHYADMVGMTMASEATVSQELGLEYAALCSVDNHGHGLSPSPLTADEISANASANADTMFKIIQAYPSL